MIRTIWVVNHSGHNIEPAIRDFRPQHVTYLTEGNQNLSEIDRQKYNMHQRLANPNLVFDTDPFRYDVDALLLCGNTVLNVVATALLFVELKVPYVRLLIWDGRRRSYYMKDLDMGGLHKLTPDDIQRLRPVTP